MVTAAGIGLLLGLVGASSRVVAFVPGLLLIGLGLGVMLTPSVNIVQSSFHEELQGEISGVSRAVSNLGSSFGAAIAGTILVSDLASGNGTYVIAMVVLAALALVGLAAAFFLPANPERRGAPGKSSRRMRSIRPPIMDRRRVSVAAFPRLKVLGCCQEPRWALKKLTIRRRASRAYRS